MQRAIERMGWLILLVFLANVPPHALAGGAEPATKVFLNGVPTPVYFNDGDSFRVLAGPLKGTRARLAGFNTLESFGPVHQWGDWTARELYYLAKEATLNARRGVWHCTSDMHKDVYGRILWDCPDLVVDQVQKGLAHVMIVGRPSAPPEYLAAQKAAIEAGVGIWAKGVPSYILTSTHSAAEEWGKGKKPYNRLVSTADGMSVKWLHNNVYEPCENVCFTDVRIDPDRLDAFVADMRKAEGVGEVASNYSDDQLKLIVSQYVRFHGTGPLQDEAHEAVFATYIDAGLAESALGDLERSEPVCMVYTPFRQRYGANKLPCLKIH